MIIVNTPGTWDYVYSPLRHADWDGLTPTDLVFPFFVFIVGLSMAFSFRKYESRSRAEWINKIIRRTILIFVVGLLLNWYPFFNKSLSDLRIFGVLQRIALAYGLGSFIVVFLRKKLTLQIVFGVILLAYYLILLFFGGEDPFGLEENAVRRLDLFLFGENHLYGGYGIPFDPEGLLSTLPAVATVLIGYLVGKEIQGIESVIDKSSALLPFGVVLIIVGVIWHQVGFPVNKPLWSSSYTLVSAGMATLLFSILIYLIDYLGRGSWFNIFRPFGLNPLISYVLSGLLLKTVFLIRIGEQNLFTWLYTQVFQNAGDYFGSFMQALCYTLLIWIVAWWMYRQRIVIKL